MQPLVSVIVPVYKAEDCLERCLDSLYKQCLTEIEILLVDDASPDRCGAICDEYAKKDPRFKVFHNKTNRGVSVARNIGIKNASCDYLMFVDSDDYVHEDFCKAAYECAVSHQADLVMFCNQRFGYTGRFGQSVTQPSCFAPEGIKNKLEALELIEKGCSDTPWNKLYRKELFKAVLYPDGYVYEDVGTTYKYVLQASRIYYLDKVLFFKCYHEGSITSLKTNKAMQDRNKMLLQKYRDLVTWLCAYDPSEKAASLLLNYSLLYCICKKPDSTDPVYVSCAKMLRGYAKTPKDLSLKRSCMLFLFRYCQPLFELICNLYGKRISR